MGWGGEAEEHERSDETQQPEEASMPQPILHPFTTDSPHLLINPDPGGWADQTHHPGDFCVRHRKLRETDIKRVLAGKIWIATYAPANGLVDRVEFDLDCKEGPGGARDRDQRYWAIRELVGAERRPLVVQTPSKWGLHMSYRIPPTPLKEISPERRSGLIAEVLRAWGLDVEKGAIEVFPQATQCKRLPIGRSMAILDPQSLQPLVEAPERPTPESSEWWRFSELILEWYSAVDDRLIPDLRALAQEKRALLGPSREAGCRPGAPPMSVCIDTRVGTASKALIAQGLTRPSMRYDVEFRVGAAIWRDPELFHALGARRPLTRENVARTLAAWLSEHHNDLSQEWRADLRRLGSPEEVIATWTGRFLHPDPRSGEAPVDRMLRAALAQSRDCGLVAPSDMTRILDVSQDLFPPGPDRYQLEVWTCALLRAVKSVVRYHRTLGHDVTEGDGYVEVALLAAWMERWPWGGSHPKGVRNYVRFRDALLSKGWIVPVSRPIWYVAGPERPGVATRYRIRTPSPVRSSELPLHRATVEARIGSIPVNGRMLSLDEAYHALMIDDGITATPSRRYGPSLGRKIRSYARAIRDPLGSLG